MPGSPLGILISDENQEVMPDIEKSIRLLRGEEGSLRLSQIVEKGFFIESQKSHILQLCDLCAYAIRRAEEQKIGHPVKPAEAAINSPFPPPIWPKSQTARMRKKVRGKPRTRSLQSLTNPQVFLFH